jgi:hypothetical protein
MATASAPEFQSSRGPEANWPCGLLRVRDCPIAWKKLAHSWVMKSLADRPFSFAYAATLLAREGGILKEVLVLRSRLLTGSGIDTNGTTRVLVATVIGILLGTLLEILLDIHRGCYYDWPQNGRYKILGGRMRGPHYVVVDAGAQKSSENELRKRLTHGGPFGKHFAVSAHPYEGLFRAVRGCACFRVG